MRKLMGLKPPFTIYPTLITKDIKSEAIKATATNQNIFAHDTTKPYFNETHKKALTPT